MVALFFNNFLPSTVGGDVVRMYDSWRLGNSKSDAVTVVVSEENRSISLAVGGVLVSGLDSRELKQRLVESMTPRSGDKPLTATEEEEE